MDTYSQSKLRKFFIVMVISASSVSLLFAQKDSIETRQLVYDHASIFRQHGVKLKGYEFNDQEINQRLTESFQYHKKASGKIGAAVLIAGAGAIFLGAGIVGDLQKETPMPSSGGGWFDGIEISYGSAPAYVLGGILVGTSVPFFISAAKNKKKMKISIDEANQLLIR